MAPTNLASLYDARIVEWGRLIGGRYEIGRKIARGSTADLFEATDPERRLVVLKILRDGQAAQEEAFARFRREAEVVAALEHPNVVRLLDFGTAEEGRPYLVMEHLVGHDLARELKKRGALPLEEAAKILIDVGRAVDAAHKKGIVHRDLKPSNVFLARVGKEQRVKVLDFGIARLLEATDQRITQTQSLFGSPLYMAPEAFRSAKLADERSDVWSLGVMFYELLTGQVPFSAETPVAVGLSVLKEELVPPSARKPELGRPVDVVMGRVLKKEPEQRYQTVRELIAAIEVFLPRGRNDTMTIAAVLAPSSASPTAHSDDDDDVPTRMRGGDDPLDSPTRARPDITAQILAAAMPVPDDDHEAPTHVKAVPPQASSSSSERVGRPPRPPAPSVPEPGESTLVDAAPPFLAAAPPGLVLGSDLARAPVAAFEPEALEPEAVALVDAGPATVAPDALADVPLRESNPNAESSRFVENPVSVTNNPIDPVAIPSRRSPLIWVVPAVAVLCGVGGWLIGRSPSGASDKPASALASPAPDPPQKDVAPPATSEPPPPSTTIAPSAPASASSESSAASADVALVASGEPIVAPSASAARSAAKPSRPPRKPRFNPTQI